MPVLDLCVTPQNFATLLLFKNTALVASKAAYRLQNSPNCFQGFEWSSSKLHFRITYS